MYIFRDFVMKNLINLIVSSIIHWGYNWNFFTLDKGLIHDQYVFDEVVGPLSLLARRL